MLLTIPIRINSFPTIRSGTGFLAMLFIFALSLPVSAADRPESFADLAERLSPAVVNISTTRTGDGVEIRFADNGPGIPAKVRERIFEPFFTTKDVGKGTGQGLAIARDVIVNKHGGKIGFRDGPETGTIFSIWLPMRRVEESSPAAAA